MGSVGAPEIVLPISQIQFPAFVFPKKFHFIRNFDIMFPNYRFQSDAIIFLRLLPFFPLNIDKSLTFSISEYGTDDGRLP